MNFPPNSDGTLPMTDRELVEALTYLVKEGYAESYQDGDQIRFRIGRGPVDPSFP